MKTFSYISRDYVPEMDLNALDKTFNTLETGHLKAVDATSKLQAAIAELDLNEAEDEYRQAIVNDIQNTVAQNTVYGNSYKALDSIIAKSGNIASNPGMIGRLRNQKQYKAFQDSVDKMNLPEDYKQYYRENNPYYYRDKVDKKGNVIGGENWQAQDRPTAIIPLNDLMTKALQIAAKESGGGNVSRWLDANGNPTSKYSESVTGEVFDTVTNSWQRLSKEKLASALQSVIETTPGAKESLAQDYKIASWKFDKYGTNPDIINKNGRKLTQSEYLQKRVNPFFDAASFYNQQSSISYGKALTAQIELARKQAGLNADDAISGVSASPYRGRVDISTTLSNPITIKNNMPSEATGIINSSKQIIANILGDVDVTKLTSSEILSMADKNKVSPIDKYKLKMALDRIQENQEYLDSIKKGRSADEQAQFDTYNAIIGMGDLPVNEYTDEYNRQKNIYLGGASYLRQYLDSDQLEQFYLNIGGKDKAVALGIQEGSSNGKPYVQLPANMEKSLYSFTRAVKNIDASMFEYLGITTSKAPVKVLEDGSEVDAVSNRGRVNDFYGGIHNLMNKLQKVNDNIVGNSGNLTLSNNTVNAATPTVAEILAIRKSNPTEASKYTQTLNDEEKEAYLAAANIDLVQSGAYMVKENNVFDVVDSNTRKEITALLRSSKANDLELSLVQDPQTGNWGTQCTIKGTVDESGKVKREPITFYTPGGINSSMFESWNRDTSFQAKNDINTYKAANRPITIASANSFGLNNSIKLVNNGAGFIVMDGKTPITEIDSGKAIELRDNYIAWQQTVNAISSGLAYPEERIRAIANKVATGLAELYGGGSDELIIKYYEDTLMSNLNM